eukprot:4002133-Heterocapsa_arctica.AAC.1
MELPREDFVSNTRLGGRSGGRHGKRIFSGDLGRQHLRQGGQVARGHEGTNSKLRATTGETEQKAQ